MKYISGVTCEERWRSLDMILTSLFDKKNRAAESEARQVDHQRLKIQESDDEINRLKDTIKELKETKKIKEEKVIDIKTVIPIIEEKPNGNAA